MRSNTTKQPFPQGFLEYINNVLAGGLLSSLFSREEQSEIIAELVLCIKKHLLRNLPQCLGACHETGTAKDATHSGQRHDHVSLFVLTNYKQH